MELARVPAWRRLRLDFALLAAAAIAEAIASRAGAFDPPAASVSAGEAVSLPSRLLIAPLIAWFGGMLLAVRILMAITARLPVPAPPRFGPVVRGTLGRSLRRRSWALATGMIGVGLVVAFGMSLAMFAAIYDDAKAADSRFVVGSDLRVTPSVLSPRPHAARLRLAARGRRECRAVDAGRVQARELGADRAARPGQEGPGGDRPRELRARGGALGLVLRRPARPPARWRRCGRSPRAARRHADGRRALRRDRAIASRCCSRAGTKRQTLEPFRVVGLFERFPGFPQGTNLVANLDYYEAATGLRARRLLPRAHRR